MEIAELITAMELRRNRCLRIGWRVFGIALGLLVLWASASLWLMSPVFFTFFALLGGIDLLLFLVYAGKTREARQTSPAADEANEQHVCEVLANLQDVRACGTLIETLNDTDGDIRLDVITTLARLLPRVQETDAEVFTPEQKALLLDALIHERDIDLRIAILKAYRTIGDAPALEPVRRLATEPITHLTDGRIRKAAAECLPYMEERVADERRRQTLLRAATAPSEPSDVLLRPAHGTAETDPQILLRPSTPEEP